RLAREAEDAAVEQGVALVGHGYRTWMLGHALARQDRQVLDRELFYVAALLHDAGIVKVVTGEDFTIRSARVVSAVAERAKPEHPTPATSWPAPGAPQPPGGGPGDIVRGASSGKGGGRPARGAFRPGALPRAYPRSASRPPPANGVFDEVAASIIAEARAVPR